VSKFEVDFPEALDNNPTISYFNYSENANEYFWNFGDGETSTEFEPVHTYQEPGYFENELIVFSEFGCSDTSMLTIKVMPFSVLSPNAFRPGSDIPENKTFMPVLLGVDETSFNMKIFNRWGHLVFETNSPDNPWDGNDLNGNELPVGNYVWISNFLDILGFEHNKKGQILLLK
jgi:gliding motility-associated-like protein